MADTAPRGRRHLHVVPDPDPVPADPHGPATIAWQLDRQVRVECSCGWTRRYLSSEQAKAGHREHREDHAG